MKAFADNITGQFSHDDVSVIAKHGIFNESLACPSATGVPACPIHVSGRLFSSAAITLDMRTNEANMDKK